jgi:hypothetical protein
VHLGVATQSGAFPDSALLVAIVSGDLHVGKQSQQRFLCTELRSRDIRPRDMGSQTASAIYERILRHPTCRAKLRHLPGECRENLSI